MAKTRMMTRAVRRLVFEGGGVVVMMCKGVLRANVEELIALFITLLVCLALS